MQPPMDDADFQQDQNQGMNDSMMSQDMGFDQSQMDNSAFNAGPPEMGINDSNIESPMGMDTGQSSPDIDSGDDTMSIINQLTDTDKEAVRSYAKSMLARDETKQDDGNDDGPQQMMETVVFTKKQLRKIKENFGPSQDELMKKDKRKGLNKKENKIVNSPFSSPFS